MELYKGAIVDISAESVIVEAHGTEAEIDALVALLRSYGIKELVRTGATVMLRGAGASRRPLDPPAEARGASPRPSEGSRQPSSKGTDL